MTSFFIEPEWLELVRGGLLFYPAAGKDYKEPLKVFQNHIDTFWFCDSYEYPAGLGLPKAFGKDDDCELVSRLKISSINGMMAKHIIEVEPDGATPLGKPNTLSEIYRRRDGTTLRVLRERNFAQVTLRDQIRPRSIGIFMHRGDSTGEGGSNIFFLSNKKTEEDPVGDNFNTLCKRLADKALVISDGSNTDIQQFRHFYFDKNADSEAGFNFHADKSFDLGGFHWRCVGWLARKYGPTLVWGLQRHEQFRNNPEGKE